MLQLPALRTYSGKFIDYVCLVTEAQRQLLCDGRLGNLPLEDARAATITVSADSQVDWANVGLRPGPQAPELSEGSLEHLDQSLGILFITSLEGVCLHNRTGHVDKGNGELILTICAGTKKGARMTGERYFRTDRPDDAYPPDGEPTPSKRTKRPGRASKRK